MPRADAACWDAVRKLWAAGFDEIGKQPYPGQGANRLLQEFQALPAQVDPDQRQPGEVAPGSGEATDESGADGIRHNHEDLRDRVRRALYLPCGAPRDGDNGVYLPIGKILGEPLEESGSFGRKAMQEFDVLTLLISQIVEGLLYHAQIDLFLLGASGAKERRQWAYASERWP